MCYNLPPLSLSSRASAEESLSLDQNRIGSALVMSLNAVLHMLPNIEEKLSKQLLNAGMYLYTSKCGGKWREGRQVFSGLQSRLGAAV